jgi:hypothetical protein
LPGAVQRHDDSRKQPSAGLEEIGQAIQSVTMQASVIELHLREVAQLFDSLDPCPFYERDLDTDAEEYIVASARELSHPRVTSVVVYVDKQSGESNEQHAVEQAIRSHFERKRQLAAGELSELMRRGWISLFIGLAFLATMLIAHEAVDRSMVPGPLQTALTESLLIGGWVAMWKPLEIFLYDWWPIVGRRRLYASLSRIAVRLAPHEHPRSGAQAAPAGGV